MVGEETDKPTFLTQRLATEYVTLEMHVLETHNESHELCGTQNTSTL